MTQVNDRAAELTAWFHERFPDREQMLREHRQSEADADWYCQNHAQLLDEYEGRWIAIHEGAVRAVADSHDGLLAEMDRRGLSQKKGILRRQPRRNPPKEVPTLFRK